MVQENESGAGTQVPVGSGGMWGCCARTGLGAGCGGADLATSPAWMGAHAATASSTQAAIPTRLLDGLPGRGCDLPHFLLRPPMRDHLSWPARLGRARAELGGPTRIWPCLSAAFA